MFKLINRPNSYFVFVLIIGLYFCSSYAFGQKLSREQLLQHFIKNCPIATSAYSDGHEYSNEDIYYRYMEFVYAKIGYNQEFLPRFSGLNQIAVTQIILDMSNWNLGRLEYLGNNEVFNCTLLYLALTKPNIRVLDLSKNGLTVLPSGIGYLYNLKKVSLKSNNLTSLTNMNELNELKWLSLSRNRFTEIPKEIFGIEHLKKLYLSENHIELLPSNLEDLGILKVLDLSDNPIQNHAKSQSERLKKTDVRF